MMMIELSMVGRCCGLAGESLEKVSKSRELLMRALSLLAELILEIRNAFKRIDITHLIKH